MGLFLKIPFQGAGKVNAGLVGYTKEHEEYVGQFIVKFAFAFAIFEGLITIGSCHNPGQFPYFLGKDGHVGKLAKVTDSSGLYPPVSFFLGFL
jgi:hypothetical protein